MVTGKTPEKYPKPSTKPLERWVWRCDDASIAAGQTSLLAVLETLLSLMVYGWLAFHYDRQWWLLVSAVAAPILLTKSMKSKRLGLILLRRYKRHAAEHSSKIIETGWFLLIIGATFGSAFLFAKLIHQIFPEWALWQIVLLSCPLILLVNGGIVGIRAGIHLLERTRSFHQEHPFLSSAPKLGRHLLAIYFLILNIVFNEVWPLAFGVWLRSMFIRIYSTLRHPIAGLRCFPQNWQEILWGLDFTYPPELLPGAARVSQLFNPRGLIVTIKQKNGNKVDRAISGTCLICWYVPALLWRWSLKSTLWLWWPLALLLNPPLEGLRADEVRDFAALRINGALRFLVVLSVLVILWLSLSRWPDLLMWSQILLKTLNLNLSDTLNDMLRLAPPHKGLFEIALWLCCGVTFVVWWLGDRLKVIHKNSLEEEKAFSDLSEERQALFVARAQTLAHWYTGQVVAFIILGYSVALWLSKAYYPEIIGRFLPAWSLPYL